MTAFSVLRMALRSIRASRTRSMLTMLGIVIGVSSVILLVAAGHATSAAVESKLEALGTNVLTIYPGGDDSFGGFEGGDEPQLGARDVDAIRAVGAAGGVAAAYPVLSPSSVTLSTGTRSLTAGEFSGAPAGYLRTTNVRFSQGAAYTSADDSARARVIVLGSTAATRLFGPGRAVGRSLTANGVRFRVVGVMRPRGAQLGDNTAAMAPYTATRDNIAGPTAPLASIAVQTTTRTATRTARAPIAAALRASRRLPADKANDFSLFDQAELLGTTDTIAKVLRLVLAGVAATSLFVGGMGVMNIMLVTVVERTREIGIRKAIGARKQHIVAQFLTEAVVLCLSGGVAGIVLGLTAAAIATAATGYAATVGPGAIALALGVSVAVGMFFGYYPANRAASLQPIDALRHD